MSNVLDDTMHCSTKKLFVFIVHRHYDEKFRAPRRVVVDLTESEPRVFKVVGIACSSGVPHVSKLALSAERTHIEKLLWDFVVYDKVSMKESIIYKLEDVVMSKGKRRTRHA
jgi:hypothetical protein